MHPFFEGQQSTKAMNNKISSFNNYQKQQPKKPKKLKIKRQETENREVLQYSSFK